MTAATPAPEPAPPTANPYVGPRPFERQDEDKLFGRDDETRELLAIITATPITLLYAQSGAGKTSLLKAKLQPLLERRPCEVYGPLRVASPDAPKSGVKNLYTFNALASLCGPDSKLPSRLGSTTLPEYLDKLAKPAVKRGEIRMPRVLIFDQFEDLFTRYPDRWQDRTKFFEEISAALAADPRLRIVFGMREEYLATFESYASDLPATSIARFRLERLRRDAAAEAIERPLDSTNTRFKPKALEKLLDNLMALPKVAGSRTRYEEFAEAVQLQIVCFNLWKAFSERPETERVEIDTSDIKTYGDVEEALRGYYKQCADEVAQDLGKTHRFNIGKLRAWFERTFINDEGQRSMVYKGASMTAGFPNEVIAALERKYLIRTEPRGTSTWCELSHERFIKPILESNRQWRREADVGNRAAYLEKRASFWVSEGRPSHLLLTGTRLREAQEWLDTEGANFGASKTLEDFIAKSKEQQQARSTTRLRLTVLLAVLAVIIIAALALQAYMMARRQKALSERERNVNRSSLAAARNDVATAMLNERRPLDALPWAIKAVSTASEDQSSVETLRKALALTMSSAAWLRRPSTPLNNMSFSPDGKLALTTSRTEVCVWNLVAETPPACRNSSLRSRWAGARFSRDGGFVFATAVSDEPRNPTRMVIWPTDETDKPKNIRPAPGNGIIDGCGKEHLLVTAGPSNLYVFDTKSETVRALPIAKHYTTGDVSADCSAIVATSDLGRTATLWSNGFTPHPLGALSATSGFVSASFDESGKYVLVLQVQNDLAHSADVFDVKTGRHLNTVTLSPAPYELIRIVAGTWIVGERVLKNNRVLDYYEISTGRHETIDNTHQGNYGIDYGPTTITAMTSAESTSIVESLDLIHRSRSKTTIPDSEFTGIDVSRDGRKLMTIKSGVVRVWNLDAAPPNVKELTPAQLIAASCKELHRFGYDSDVRSECK